MSAASPALLKTSSTFYGPDGPWQAVTVSLGDPPQPIDLFPGGLQGSHILTSTNCSGGLTCAAGGVFDISRSSTFYNTTLANVYTGQAYCVGTFPFRAVVTVATDTLMLERLDANNEQSLMLRNFSLFVVPQFSITLPTGAEYPLQAGSLSLGAGATYAFQSSGDENLIPGALAKEGSVPSSTFGLHIGATSLNQPLPLSLWLGGYDRQRIVGPVSTQSPDQLGELPIVLQDIGIAVESGGSPFPFLCKDGLLRSGSTETNTPLSVFMNTQASYLYLPRSTCNAITENLPVSFNSSLALYLWDTKSPEYHKIVTSPSYLSFTFDAPNSNNSNITIKVPFRLLNLTLEPPLVTNPTPYFPCQDPNLDGRYSLGRALLQAAFIGASWHDSKWYLAQAPGPNISSEPAMAAFSGPPESSSSQWAATWTGSWTPLPESGGLSRGSIAGVIVGVVTAICLVATGTFALWRKRKKQKIGRLSPSNSSASALREGPLVPIGGVPEPELTGIGLQEMADQEHPTELPSEHRIELAHRHHAELPNDYTYDRTELPERSKSRAVG